MLSIIRGKKKKLFGNIGVRLSSAPGGKTEVCGFRINLSIFRRAVKCHFGGTTYVASWNNEVVKDVNVAIFVISCSWVLLRDDLVKTNNACRH